ncbi:hypothetical protein [Streptomyces sp. NPDC059009]|uniref:hypothetical protein n=1 Tax=Streptomyces sp. NPDC059009 TaxID=3346694 RepID=UPI0036C17949
MTNSSYRPRLLPWQTPDGKPCYLAGAENGYVSRVADNIESVQLGMAGELLDHVGDLLGDTEVTTEELRFAVSCLNTSLRDVKRIADSRGARMADAGADDGPDEGPQLPAGVFG